MLFPFDTATTAFEAFELCCAAHPDAPAVLRGHERVSFAQLRQMSDQIARILVRQGVVRQTGVVLMLPNSAVVGAAVLAAWRVGAYPVFVSPQAPTSHLDRAMALTDARLVWRSDEDFPISAEEADLPGGTRAVGAAEIGSIVFTSGSTGAPKGVTQSIESLLSGARRVGRLNGYQHGGSILCPVPFSHDYGWGQLLSCLCLGQTLILPDREGVQAICDAIERHRPEVLAGTPAVYAGLAYGVSNIRKTARGSISKATSTGAPLQPELARALQELFPGLALYANYGLTETYRSACLLPHEREGREDSVGRAIDGVRLAIVDDEGRILPPGREGEVVHIGAGTCLGYIGDPDRTAKMLRPVIEGNEVRLGVFTGDIGIMDADGYLTLAGRRDRLIKTMDVRISLDAVERSLAASQLVERVAAIDVPDKMMGRKIVAYAVLRPDVDEAMLRSWARANMTRFTLPRSFRTVDQLPLTMSGKTDYIELRHREQADA